MLCKKWVKCRAQLLPLPNSSIWWVHITDLLILNVDAICSPPVDEDEAVRPPMADSRLSFLLVKYLRLLSLLMEQSPSGMDVPISEEDDEDDEEEKTMEEEGRGRKSKGVIFQHCLNLRHTANILHTRE